MTAAARSAVLRHFRWERGHADVWRIFVDAEGLRSVVDGLADPWRDSGVTHVVGIESRGFLLGGACSVALGVGFVAIRKDHGLLPGSKVTARSDVDYRGYRPVLRMQRAVDAADRVLLVDDWAERGSQARAAAQLVGACGAVFLGTSIIVDQLDAGVRASLGRVTSIVTADELGDSPGD
ncbi:phosphoribosyltransferase [Pseudonocardia xinjiangensis]|uniref:Phosphoribosyltransferase n=1 Tax=Pseudonocardia xinjiangensis TaxID=75289 RepID=A0ABX1RA97_9PSEU|nr:phosphoribosyltransferase [Pseudonocardia xinjiangensis]